MAGNEERVGLQIDVAYPGHSALVQAIQDQRWFDAEVKKFKATADNTRDSAARLADSKLRLADATRRAKTEMDAIVSAQSKLNGHLTNGVAHVKAITAPIAAMPGPAGAMAASINAASGAFGALTSSTALVAIGIAGAIAVTSLLAKTLVDSSVATARHAEHMQVLGLQTGLTTRETERYNAAMKNMGLTVESLTFSFRFLSINIIEAIQKSGDARTAFQAVGLSVADLRTKTQGQIFEQVIRGLGLIENHAIRTDTAVKLLGRSALQVLPLAGRAFDAAADQAERVGLVLSESEKKIAASIDASKDTIARAQEGMRLQAGILASILVDPFMKMEARAAEGAANVLSTLTHLAASVAQGPLETIGRTAAKTGETLLDVAKKLAKTAVRTGDTVLGPYGLGPSDMVSEFLNSLGVPKITIKPGQGSATPPGFGSFPGEGDVAAALQLESTREQISLLDERRRLTAITVADEIKAIEPMQAQVRSAEELLVIRGKIAALQKPLFQEAMRLVERGIAGFEGMPVQATPDLRIPGPEFGGGVFDSRHKEERGYTLPELDITPMEDALAQLNASLDTSAAGLVSFAASMVDMVSSGLGRAVTDALFYSKSLEKGVTSIFRSLRDEVVAMLAQMAAKKLIKSLIPGLGALAEGGTLAMAHGGTMVPPPYIAAQHGLILSGVRDRDTVPVMAQKGEMFVSRKDTDLIREVMTALRSAIGHRSPSPDSGGNRRELSRGRPIELHAHSFMSDQRTIRRGARELADSLLDTLDSGRY